MFYQSPKHYFDTMFVILCVIAGATSRIISNTSKTPTNQLKNQYQASFIDFILDASLNEFFQSSTTISKNLSSDHNSTSTRFRQQSQTICTLLLSSLSASQMKFCLKHHDILETVLPQIIQLTKKECIRVTSDLKWNCSNIEVLLDRSNPLAFTKEAALVRSILNASMMYLTLQTCSKRSFGSCSCRSNMHLLDSLHNAQNTAHTSFSKPEVIIETQSLNSTPISVLGHRNISLSDISILRAGSPLHLTKIMSQLQGCFANTAFANAFTKAFIETDDTKALNKAHKILNEDQNYNRPNTRSLDVKRLINADVKDLAYIKWGKSAINIHNNQVGRQVVRDAIRRRCRCHGLSGACQFQTCWDELLDFSTITLRLRLIYLEENSKVEIKNSGTFEQPDLHLSKLQGIFDSNTREESEKMDSSHELASLLDLIVFSSEPGSAALHHSINNVKKVKPNQLIYLYESPDYCESLPHLKHTGTKGRECTPANNLNPASLTSKKSLKNATLIERYEVNRSEERTFEATTGTCELLCCNRGYQSKLVLELVTCNCRFKFCCEVDCGQCLSQRLQHYCL